MNRRERRADAARQRKEAGKRGGSAIERANVIMRSMSAALQDALPEQLARTLVEGQRTAVVGILSGPPEEKTGVEIALNAIGFAETILPQIRGNSAPPLACKRGCSWCCYFRVTTSVPEVLLIAEYIRQTRDQDEIARLALDSSKTGERLAGLTIQEHASSRTPCVLLKNGECSVYKARPLACRGMNSFDAAPCEQSWREDREVDTPVSAQQLALFNQVAEGLLAGLQEGGRGREPVELTRALGIALTIPDAGIRWLAGEPIFSAARLAT